MLTKQNVVQYLLQQRLLRENQVVHGRVQVVDVTRRNHNFQVISDQGRSYLVKQGKTESDKATTAHEARVYQYFHKGLGKSSGVGEYLPACWQHDEAQGILVLELLQDAKSMRDTFQELGRIPVRLAAALGRALAALHGCREELPFAESGEPPWVLSIHRPDHRIFHETSSANLRLIKIIQRFPAFCEALDTLRNEWRSDALIHLDLKWDNLLVLPSAQELKMIDWELAVPGDAGWDAGAVFSSFLSCWLQSIPITGDTPPERALALAKHPLEKMQPALKAFWQAYSKGRSFSDVEGDRFMVRAVRFAAARLILSAFEGMQSAYRPNGNMICFLQMSLNILQRPEQAAVQLLGIPLKAGEAR